MRYSIAVSVNKDSRRTPELRCFLPDTTLIDDNAAGKKSPPMTCCAASDAETPDGGLRFFHKSLGKYHALYDREDGLVAGYETEERAHIAAVIMNHLCDQY